MSYPRTARERYNRDRALDRMIRQLESGMLPHQIPGDRDVLAAAMDIIQRRVDIEDDTHTSDNYGRRRP